MSLYPGVPARKCLHTMSPSLDPTATAVCVIGPGRAGTSVTMRILNLLGVDIGPEEGIVEPGPGGPKGFWERREIVELNDRILRACGGSWRNPPSLPSGWAAADELGPLREEARALLGRAFAGQGLWGWKDPRVSLTTEFWQDLVPGLRYVICLRNPVDVADSISPPRAGGQGSDSFYYARRGPSRKRAFPLWLIYVASALANTDGCPRLFVSYEDHFEDRRGTVERLARFVGSDPPEPGCEVERRIEDFIDAGLRHFRTPPEAVLRDGDLPAEIGALYMVSELLCAGDLDAGMGGASHTDLQAAVSVYARQLLGARLKQRRPSHPAAHQPPRD